jgi:hypothetical protein
LLDLEEKLCQPEEEQVPSPPVVDAKSIPAKKSSDNPDTKSSPSFGTASFGRGGDGGDSNSSTFKGKRGDLGGKFMVRIEGVILRDEIGQ